MDKYTIVEVEDDCIHFRNDKTKKEFVLDRDLYERGFYGENKKFTLNEIAEEQFPKKSKCKYPSFVHE